MINISNNISEKLLAPIEKNNYKGWDLFDGLNSEFFKYIPFNHSSFCRLLWTQLFKRSPLNLRKICSIPKGHNAKGLALFIKGFVNKYRIDKNAIYLDKANELAEIILSQRARDRKYFCVGYNFFWEARAFSVPAYTPNMIVSSFVGHAFLDIYDIDRNTKWLNYVNDIATFIEKELKLYETDKEICFGYIPGEKVRVHNANLMGAGLFARLYSYENNEQYREYAYKSSEYSINAQKENGSWVYGEKKHHQWVDNFHTGFNLVSINNVIKYLQIENNKWNNTLQKGLKFHLEKHFLDDMTPKYYDEKLYPIDIHNYAQGIETFLTFGYKEEAGLLLQKCLDTMWDKRKHYFYYQKNRLYINKMNYLRWNQAWMFYALSLFHLINS